MVVFKRTVEKIDSEKWSALEYRRLWLDNDTCSCKQMGWVLPPASFSFMESSHRHREVSIIEDIRSDYGFGKVDETQIAKIESVEHYHCCRMFQLHKYRCSYLLI